MKTLTNSWILSILFLACGLTSNAQTTTAPATYRLLSKGEPMPFTGVATELATYRLETKKIKKQAEVIGKQAEEIAGLKKEVAVADSAKSQLSTALLDQKQLTNSAQQTVVTLRVNEAAMVKAYEAAKPKWFERPKLVGPVSFTAGSLLTGFLLLKVL